ncbi:MAG: glycerol-3-phosphate acyltransferase [Dehalococcoidales bacterium]|jgi:glycerol-3-phosphate acyltransferase PlsY
MDTWVKFVILAVAAYLLGSVPLSYLAARSRGVDLRRQGTQQVGGGNLWRTTSRKLGLFVGIFDFCKGIIMVAAARIVGLSPGLQLLVGLAAIIGHDWPVFLRFHGGRGIATSLGIIIILPIINIGNDNTYQVSNWPLVAFLAVAVAGVVIARRTPVPILIGLILMPIISALIKAQPLSLTLGYAALVVIIIVKRLIAQPSAEKITTGMGRVLLNRLLFDRDIRDRAAWVQRKQSPKKENRA